MVKGKEKLQLRKTNKKEITLPLYFGYGLKLSLIRIKKTFFWPFKKYWQHILATTVLIILVSLSFFLYQSRPSLAATYNFTQTNLSGGATTANAIHPTNETGWTQFSASTDADFASVANQLTIAVNQTPAGSVTQTTDTDFNGGTFATTAVNGTGISADIGLGSPLNWLTGWSYRKVINIDNTNGTSVLTNYQVKIELKPSNFDYSKASATLADLRFTTSNSTTTIPYWIENVSTTATSTIWVKVPLISAGSTVTIYMYYGNTNAISKSNGAATFMLFDDGEGHSNGDSLITGGWTVDTGSNFIYTATSSPQGSMSLYKDNSGDHYAHKDFTPEADGSGILEYYMYDNGDGGFYSFVWADDSINNTTAGIGYYKNYGANYLVTSPGYVKLTDVPGRSVGWHKFRVDVHPDGSIRYYVDGIESSISTSTVDVFNRVLIRNYWSSDWWDAIRVREYTPIEPTTNVGVTNIYAPSGAFTSSVLNIPNVTLGTLTWTATTTSATTVKFQIASSPDNTTWSSFVGPDGTTSTYYTISGTQIWSGDNGNKYIKYKAYLSTTDSTQTPQLGSVTIGYNNYQPSSILTSSPYNASDAKNELAGIKWIESLPSASTTIKFQMRTAPDASGSPGTWSSWMGPTGTSASYFTDTSSACTTSTVTGGTEVDCSVPNTIAIGDGSSDQWIQYKVFLATTNGVQTPILKQVVLVYVVNAPPEFNTSSVSAIPNNDGSVSVNYSVRDPDTDTGTVTKGFITPSFQYSLNGGTSWAPISSSCLGTNDLANKAVATSTWSSYTATWNPKCESGIGTNTFSDTAEVKVVANDNEAANNTAFQNSPNFILLTKPLIIDASQSPAVVTLPVMSGITQMKVGLTLDLSDVSTWSTFASTATVSLTADPGTAYAQFKDGTGNTSAIVSVQTIETPTSLMVQDTSNVKSVPHVYRLFVAWKVVNNPANGFKQYSIFRSTDKTNWTQIGTITNRLLNYYGDSSVASTTQYYYKVTSEDNSNNISYFSSYIGPGLADGIQDSNEGGGGVSTIPPTISNIQVSNTTTNSATITWTTDTLSDSNVYFDAASSYPGTLTTSYTNSQGVPSMVTSHSVTLSGLQPSSKYYFLVKSTDPSNNSGIKSYSTSTFTTSPGPIISNIVVSSVSNNTAKIIWNTNVPADSTIVYSVNSDLSSSVSQGSVTLTKDHSFTLSGLSQGQKYYFYIKSSESGYTAYDKNIVNGVVTYYTLTTTQNVTPPTISNISSSVSTSTALITWKTDKLSDSKVNYGSTTSYGQTATSSTLTIDHSLNISGLTPNTTYHYQIVSSDANSNTATSTDNTLTTLYLSISIKNDITPPVISSVTASTVSDTQATVTWTTNELSTSQVSYGASSSYSSQTNKDPNPTYQHSATITGLTKLTEYHYQVVSDDLAGNAASSTDKTFKTTEKPGATKTIYQGGGTTFITKNPSTASSSSPVVSTVSAKDISYTGATIVWNTDKPSDSFVEYGINNNYTNMTGSIKDISSVTSHSVTLTSLIPGTTYHFRTLGKDNSGNLGESQDKTFSTKSTTQTNSPTEAIPQNEKKAVSQITSFLTKLTSPYSLASVEDILQSTAQRVVNPPLISGSKLTVEAGVDWADIKWVTNKKSNSLVSYAISSKYSPNNKDPYVITSGNPDEMVTNHLVKLTNLADSSTYHFQVSSKAKIGGLSETKDSTFKTLSKNTKITSFEINTITQESIKFSWQTGIPTKSEIKLTDSKTGAVYTKNNNSYLSYHTSLIDNLIPGDEYTIQITSIDEKGNKSISSIYPFTAILSSNPPVISDVLINSFLIPGNTERVQTIIRWKTDKPSTSRAYYQQGINVNAKTLKYSTMLYKNLVRNHILITTSLYSGRIYQIRVKSSDYSGRSSYSKNYAIITAQSKKNVIDVIMKTFKQTFGFLGKI